MDSSQLLLEPTQVLVADDDPTFLLILEQFLIKQDIKVQKACSGTQALALFQEQQPDMVILDGSMPGLDGIETCRQIRQLDGGGDVPILMLTAMDHHGYIDQAFAAGINDYMVKPVNWAVLRNRIYHITENHKLVQKLNMTMAVFDNTSEGIIITDATNHIEAVNPAFTRITGYNLAEVKGTNPGLSGSRKVNSLRYQLISDKLGEHGSWSGERWNLHKNGQRYLVKLSINAIKNKFAKTVQHVIVFQDITDKKAYEQTIWKQANYDTLTGLPNRALFKTRLPQAIERAVTYDKLGAVFFLDLDGFKAINDNLGHSGGDELLKIVAQRLLGVLRLADTVARLGGDEFAIIINDLKDSKQAEHVASKIVNQLAMPVQLSDGVEIKTSVSIGIAIFPSDADNADLLLKNADLAMYSAKAAGRNGYRFYTDSLDDTSLQE